MQYSTEEQMPDYVLAEIEDLLAGLPQQLAALFAPKPWPRAEMLAMARLIAAETGVPDLCGDVFCRRSGLCRAETIGGNGPPCAEFWSDEALTRLEGGLDGLVLAWMLAERADKSARDRLAARSGEPAPQAARRKAMPSRRARKR
ncbi:hypothetical protein J1C56_13065 [Aminobacter anthyllidis]|uniref:Uncharacterized protein n=1 Tax=Aminobacter anthyllidis TaxID=1035067 RepID=A0A9X1AB31_9HYPH|nr:hypothetical protein [Aminobacter anthyllidis]MBT1156524.1 hypothetical protein [Aminobacter anthyllidis]